MEHESARYESRPDGPTESAVDTAREQARQVSTEVSEKAREVGGSLQNQAREQVDTRSTQVGEQVASVGDAMRTMGDQLRSQGNELPAQLAHQAGNKAEELGRYLRESDADRILRDVEDFGRRQPWVVAAAGLALGVAAARFMKASSRRRYTESMHGTGRNDARALRAPAAREVDHAPAPATGIGSVGTTPDLDAGSVRTAGTAGTSVTPLGDETAATTFPTDPLSRGSSTGTTGEQERGTYPPRGRE